MDINEQKDRKLNPYYYQLEHQVAEDDYSEESDADSVWDENTEGNQVIGTKEKKWNKEVCIECGWHINSEHHLNSCGWMPNDS